MSLQTYPDLISNWRVDDRGSSDFILWIAQAERVQFRRVYIFQCMAYNIKETIFIVYYEGK